MFWSTSSVKDQTLTFQEYAFSVNSILKATGMSEHSQLRRMQHEIITKCTKVGYSTFTKSKQLLPNDLHSLSFTVKVNFNNI